MGRQSPSRVRIPPSPLTGGYTSPPLSAPVAQLDRASVYGTEGQRFESSRARCRIPLGKGISGRSRTPTGGNRATPMVLATAADRGAGGVPTWFEVRGGLPGRRSPAQAVGRHAGRSPRDQAQTQRRGSGEAARSDAA